MAGGSGLVMIIGEAGIGKTALAEDLAADADTDGATVLRTRCYEAERSLFLQPIAEAIAPVVSRMSASALPVRARRARTGSRGFAARGRGAARAPAVLAR